MKRVDTPARAGPASLRKRRPPTVLSVRCCSLISDQLRQASSASAGLSESRSNAAAAAPFASWLFASSSKNRRWSAATAFCFDFAASSAPTGGALAVLGPAPHSEDGCEMPPFDAAEGPTSSGSGREALQGSFSLLPCAQARVKISSGEEVRCDGLGRVEHLQSSSRRSIGLRARKEGTDTSSFVQDGGRGKARAPAGSGGRTIDGGSGVGDDLRIAFIMPRWLARRLSVASTSCSAAGGRGVLEDWAPPVLILLLGSGPERGGSRRPAPEEAGRARVRLLPATGVA